jgi:alpha-beta hydrolase superfamily lysophospholipase
VLSRDPEVGRLAALDPGNPERMTLRLGRFGFAAQERVRATLSRLAVPTLVIHGLDDRLVPPSATESFKSLPGVTRHLYPGLRHESLNEPEGPQVVADVVAWLREVADRVQ